MCFHTLHFIIKHLKTVTFIAFRKYNYVFVYNWFMKRQMKVCTFIK